MLLKQHNYWGDIMLWSPQAKLMRRQDHVSSKSCNYRR